MRGSSVVVLAIVSLVVAAGCASNSSDLKPVSQIPAGVASEGSLANEKLVADTMAGLNQISQGRIALDTDVARFVIQQPVGDAGSRAWRELWVIDPEAEPEQFIITFHETGLGSATFEILQ